MVGWHHRLNGHGFGQTPGDGEGQGGLARCPTTAAGVRVPGNRGRYNRAVKAPLGGLTQSSLAFLGELSTEKRHDCIWILGSSLSRWTTDTQSQSK